MNLIPTPYRILALVLLIFVCISAGVVAGLDIESNRRDAQALVKEREDHKAFQRTLENGKQHAANAIAWQNKARIYYRNWQEDLKNVPDNQLAECPAQDTGTNAGAINRAPAVLLTATWLGLYNAAWLPELDGQGDTGGAAYSLVETGAPSTGLRAGVTPREVLANTGVNAALCGEDRKRLDELIDHLVEAE